MCLNVTAAVIRHQGQVLAARRPEGAARGGLWEFPGGKLEPGETPEDGLRRELREELDIEVADLSPLCTVVHQYPDVTVRLLVYACQLLGSPPCPREHQALAWLLPGDLAALDWSAADRAVVRLITGAPGGGSG